MSKAKTPEEYVVVRYNDNYADEFDVNSAWIVSVKKWNAWKKKVKTITKPAEIYFGTNQAIEIQSGEAVIKACKVAPISKREAITLIEYLGDGYRTLADNPVIGQINVFERLLDRAMNPDDYA